MITELIITSEYGDSLTLSVPGPSDGYLVKEIEGLDPVPVALVSDRVATLEGETYQSSKLDKRNIILKIKLSQNYAGSSVEARRNRLTSLGLGKQELSMIFTSVELGQVSIAGRVETVDAPTNTDDPMVTMSIVCFSPFFKGRNHIWEGEFLPGSLETLTYEGTSPAPVLLRAYIPTATSEPTGFSWELTHTPTERRVGYARFAAPIGTTSTSVSFDMNSTPGGKYFRRSSDDTSVLRLTEFQTLTWPLLLPGEFTLAALPLSGVDRGWATDMTWTDLFGAI